MYKSVVNKLDKFLIRKSDYDLGCNGCPLDNLNSSSQDFTDKLVEEFNIESDCIINFFYSIKDVLSEDRMNFLLEKLKENNISFINCGKKGASRFIKILKSVISNDLEIE